jgi:4-alpha-glucanotransferase
MSHARSSPTLLPRRSGVLVPLFSMPSTLSWGIGEIADIVPLAAWLAGAGQRILQLLPINEMAPGQKSPYSAISAMAIDPIFISLRDVEDFVAEGGEAALAPSDAEALARARRARRVDYATVRPLKLAALRAGYARFRDADWARGTARSGRFAAFLREQAWWLDDYALFRAIHAREGERSWTTWDRPLRLHEDRAIDAARRDLADEVHFHQYLQWLAWTAWQAARAAAAPVALFGDLPFMVDVDSADVWANQSLFDLTGAVGAPPDAFSETGQNWGLPVYDWRAMARADFDWLRRRARRNAGLYAGYRVDHLVGFYRTYVFPRNGGKAYFTPADRRDQLPLGERVMRVFVEAGAQVIAEDLGTVPNFVRASLRRLGIPGYRVLRWEREWHQDGQPFRDPRDYPAASVATSGTHDTEPLAVWWDEASVEERAAVVALPFLEARLGPGFDAATARFDPAIRDALLEMLVASGSSLLILPIQDLFGWTDRVNVPADVSEDNWTYRLPWPVDRVRDDPEAQARARELGAWTATHRPAEE